MYGDASALENSLVVPQMVGHRVTYDTMILLLNIQLKEMERNGNICSHNTQMFTATLLIIGNK